MKRAAAGFLAGVLMMAAMAWAEQPLLGDLSLRRILFGKATALVAGDFTLDANWGSGASVSVAGGSTDSAGQISVTVGTSASSTSHTVTLTFKDGAWTTAPKCVASTLRAAAPSSSANIGVSSVSTTAVTFDGTFSSTNGHVWIITWHCH